MVDFVTRPVSIFKSLDTDRGTVWLAIEPNKVRALHAFTVHIKSCDHSKNQCMFPSPRILWKMDIYGVIGQPYHLHKLDGPWLTDFSDRGSHHNGLATGWVPARSRPPDPIQRVYMVGSQLFRVWQLRLNRTWNGWLLKENRATKSTTSASRSNGPNRPETSGIEFRLLEKAHVQFCANP